MRRVTLVAGITLFLLATGGCEPESVQNPEAPAGELVRVQGYTGQVLDTIIQGGVICGFRESQAWDINTKNRIVGMQSCIGNQYAVWWGGTNRKLFAFPQPNNSHFSHALAINDKNQAVGFTNLGSGERAVYWPGTSTVQLLGTLGGPKAVAQDINNAGTVVGWSDLSNGDFHAFTWTPTQGMHDLGTLTGGTFSIAYSINQNGVIAGMSETATPFVVHMVTWTNGVIKDLGTLPGGGFAVAHGININGDLVGESDGVPGGRHAFLRLASNGVVKDLGVVGIANAINDKGRLVTGPYTQPRGAAVLVPLPPVPGLPNASAQSLNTCGNIVGFAFATWPNNRASLWTHPCGA